MDYLALIQARCGATRLPNKILLDLEGKTVLERVVERVKKSKRISEIMVVTTINVEDIAVVQLCSNKAIRIFCGSSDDVLDRFYQAAKLLRPKNIIRITADCPMMDPEIIDLVIDSHEKSGADYTSNTIKELFPDGEDVEVFTYSALETAWQKAALPSEREHVTPYLKKESSLFKLESVESETNYSTYRWTLDEPRDYEFIKRIYKDLYPLDPLFGIKMILKHLHQNPTLKNINHQIVRNEGLLKSLADDKKQ